MFVRTILGDIDPQQLGPCGAHEHIVIGESFPTFVNPEFLLNDTDRLVEELKRFYDEGGRAMVDSMPCDAGREAVRQAEVSRRTKVHIVVPTGLHLASYYPPGHWSGRLSDEELAELFIADIEEGIDELDYGCPIVKRTPHKAGVIKVASGKDRLSDHERKVFRAACLASKRTGAPILTHTEQGTAALDQIELFLTEGMDLRHIVLSHTDRLPDEQYHRELLAAGARLEYDSGFRWPANAENHTVTLLAKLLPEFPDQLMVGMDAAKRKYWRSFGGAPGMQFLVAELPHLLHQHGVDEKLLQKLLIDNPAAAYTFSPVADA